MRKKKIFTVVFYPIKIRRQAEMERVHLLSEPIKREFGCSGVSSPIQGNVNLNWKLDLTSPVQTNFKFVMNLVWIVAPGCFSTFYVS